MLRWVLFISQVVGDVTCRFLVLPGILSENNPRVQANILAKAVDWICTYSNYP